MNIYIENKFNFHYEIIESVLSIFLEKIGIKGKYTVYLKCATNESFEKYIKKKFTNVFFIKRKPKLLFSHKIWTTFYCKYIDEYEYKPNNWYICHDIEPWVLEKKNIFFVTPLCGVKRWFLPTLLPSIVRKKSCIPIFIVQGKIDETRRNYASLVPFFEMYKDRNFLVKIIGDGALPNYLGIYKNKIKFCPILNFEEYHNEFSDVDCLLPLIDDTFEHNYFKSKLTSSISYVLAYNLPVIVHKKLVDIYHLKNASVYTNETEFLEEMGKFLNTYQ
jgi:hypothetical protein